MFKTMKAILFIIIMVNIGNLAYAGEKHGVAPVDDLQIDVWVNKSEGATYYYGEDLAIYLRANNDCYVVLYDIDPEGNVSLLYPADYESSCFVSGGEVVRIPDVYDDYHLEISGPNGQEHIYAVATYNRIEAPDFIRYEYFEYGNWDSYYDDFIHSVNGEREKFATELNRRIAKSEYTSAHTMFFIDDGYRHHKWYRHWSYDPYYVGSIWVGSGYPGCEVWIDGVYWGIAPILIPEIYIGRHWVWVYYNGYPCWQDYVYINRGQRYYVDAKIGRRFLDYEYGRASMRDWRFKYEVEKNEPGFAKKAEKVREKHTRPRQSAPAKVVEKYSKVQASKPSRTEPQVKTDRSSIKSTPAVNSKVSSKSDSPKKSSSKPTNRFKSYTPQSDNRTGKSSTKNNTSYDSGSSKKKSLNTKSGSAIIKDRSVEDNDDNSKGKSSVKSKTPSVKSSGNSSQKSKPASISQPKSSPRSSGASKKSSGSNSKDKSKGKRSHR